MGLPVTFAIQMAPGCATMAGPRGPSTVIPTGWPSSIRRLALRAARTALRDVEPRAVVYPKRWMIRAVHSPSKLSLVMTTMSRWRK